MSVGETLEELVLTALASVEGEYFDQISYLPRSYALTKITKCA